MKKFCFQLFITMLTISACSPSEPETIAEILKGSPQIEGRTEYLNSPYVTAGNRLYMVGHQDGSFPDLGWHIKGEMGGVWNHPIKLMDGFEVEIEDSGNRIILDKADSFVNFPMANRHTYDFKDSGLEIERWQFVPDGIQGIIVQFMVRNTNTEARSLHFKFTGHSDLRPTWLGEQTGMIDSSDVAKFNTDHDAWVMQDESNPWSVMFGSDSISQSHQETKNEQSGLGTSAAILYNVNIDPNSSAVLNIFIAGSYVSVDDMEESYENIKTNAFNFLRAKKERYAELALRTKLTIPDKDMEQTFEWLKYNCDWLVRTVPEVGTGIAAGIPDYPWWFGVDSEYALKGYMAIGQDHAVYETISLLDSVSHAVNGNGRIIHEMSSNGAVFNKGNINETPQFASLIWEIYKWNGDREFLMSYYPTVKSGLQWLMDTKDANKNLFPDGFGMMEIHGLDSEMIDVASYTQRAFEDAAKIAAVLNDRSSAESYNTIADKLRKKINEEFWSDTFNSYADFIGTDKQALHLIEDAIVRADTLNKPWAIEELRQTQQTILDNPSRDPRPFVLHHNWVVNTPLEMGIAEPEKALKALKTAEKFVNPFGVFVTGIDRDESAGSDDGSFKGSQVFSYTGAVMTLPTAVQAVAENNYGRPEKALNYLQRMTRTFSYALPGSMYEVSPDYGMMTQAWNIYGFAIPIVQQFFGIDPMASEKMVVIKPRMPESWDKASIENVRIGENSISVFYQTIDTKKELMVTQESSEWTVKLVLPPGSYQVKNGEGKLSEHDDAILWIGKGSSIELTEE
ncbi:MAG: glycogen debranching protein [Flavobacteriaceae bacterium]|nr:glycogen debranching protein [Flavobacteriaceae bacterium]